MYMFNCNTFIKHNIDYITFIIKQYIDYNNTINYLFTKYKAQKKSKSEDLDFSNICMSSY